MKKFKSHKATSSTSDELIIYGRHACISALKNPNRHIQKLLITEDNKKEIDALSLNISYKITDRKDIEKLLPKDAVHQGFALYCSRLENTPLENLIEKSSNLSKCHILLLDLVTDPQNIGAIIRSCAAFNTLGLVLQDKNSPLESGAMVKASAGTIEHLPISRVTNLNRAIEKLKENDFWIMGMDGYATTTIDKINKSGKIAIVMGSEGKGLRRLVEENCDSTVKLPINENVESLNVSTATAIALYELNKD